MSRGVWQATIVDELGNVLPSSSISVRDQGGALVALYDAAVGGSALDNPFNADSSGLARFYTAAGLVDITATSGAFSQSWVKVVIAGTAATVAVGTADAELPTNLTVNTALDLKVDKVSGESLITDAERNKLAAIEAEATKNATDAFLLARTNHTGEQPISTVTDLQESLNQQTALQRSIAASNDDLNQTLRSDFANQSYSRGDKVNGFIDITEDFHEQYTFTRASTKTAFGADGILRTVAVDEPAYSYDPVTREALGLLIEEQRTNLVLQSSNFADPVWSKSEVDVEPGAVAAPDGALSGARLYKTTAGSFRAIVKILTVAVGDYTPSFYVKKASASKVTLGFTDNVTADTLARAVYDFDIDILDNSGATDVKRELLSNGWVRLYAPGVSVANGNTRLYIYPGAYNSQLISDDVYIWQAQFEPGSTPSSPIYTEASQVTRAADNCSRVLGAEFNASEGTLYAEFITGNGSINAEFNSVACLGSGSISNSMTLIFSSAKKSVRFINYGGAQITIIEPNGSTEIGSKVKAAFTYTNDGNIKLASKGVVYSGSTVLADTALLNELLIGNLRRVSDTFRPGAPINTVKYYPRALTESELITLTTPEA